MKYTDPTISDHHLISKIMKNDGKSKPSLNIENKAEDINTMSYGKAIRLQKHHGNWPHVSKMVQKTSFKNINAKISHNHITDMSNFIIPKITLTCPSEEWPFHTREAEERAESRQATFWMPLVLESPVQSGYWAPGSSNWDRDQLALSQKLEITGPDHCKLVIVWLAAVSPQLYNQLKPDIVTTS